MIIYKNILRILQKEVCVCMCMCVCIYIYIKDKSKIRKLHSEAKFTDPNSFSSLMIPTPSCNSSEIHTGIFVFNDFNSTQR